MNRRELIKSMALGAVSVPLLRGSPAAAAPQDAADQSQIEVLNALQSPWHKMPDMQWAGPAYWTNRLQDWRIKNGALECVIRGKNRTVSCLTHQLETRRGTFHTAVHVQVTAGAPASSDNRVGLRLGAKGPFQDYRSAAIFGDGLDVGVTTNGALFIENDPNRSNETVSPEALQKGIVLDVNAEPRGMHYVLRLTAHDPASGNVLASLQRLNIASAVLEGNVALLSDFRDHGANDHAANGGETVACRIRWWRLEGRKLGAHPAQVFGPICFAQYTQHQSVMKLTAQLMPVPLPGHAVLELKRGNSWRQVARTKIDTPAYTARFRLDHWDNQKEVPYRVRYDLPLRDGAKQSCVWAGTIAHEPLEQDQVKALVCCCNGGGRAYGFPNQEVVDHAALHAPDLVMFVGDQYYGMNGGFGTQTAPKEKAYLDMLRKWYQFGWSYRELFRHRPSICIPDDHDVWQGNLWGADGKKMPDKPGYPYDDRGGYKMPAEWVNLVYNTQTSHMPDPYDPEPMQQGIHVFYTDWTYGGVSFAIIEDREFKSGPKSILPKEAQEANGYAFNANYNPAAHNYADATLLGERQLKFLRHWVEDWGQHIEFKAVVSATPFHSLITLPGGIANERRQPHLPVPEPGHYVEGDVRVGNLDTDGWPQSKRDEALRIIRKAFAPHLVGDQHLAAITQYGVDNWRDAGYQFTVPALNNIWPRRWWPPVPKDHQPVPGQPPYTGNYKDGLGNKMHVAAVANPRRTGLEPAIVYDRATGYGVVTFDKQRREIKMECWPRYINPKTEPDGQYLGWPVTVTQQENYSPPDALSLPTLNISGSSQPLVRVISEENGETVSVLRIRGPHYQPRVAAGGTATYTIEVTDTASRRSRTLKSLHARRSNDAQRTVRL